MHREAKLDVVAKKRKEVVVSRRMSPSLFEILRENDEKFSKRFARCTNFLHSATDRVARGNFLIQYFVRFEVFITMISESE